MPRAPARRARSGTATSSTHANGARCTGSISSTFDDKGNFPALTLDFFRHLGRAMPRRVLAVLCRRGGQLIAGALLLRSATTLYGRYWGCSEQVEGLHFEACYYQGIEYCLREGLQRFEPGAQGEHKLARGFLPTATHSFHWIGDARFRGAIADALARERRAAARIWRGSGSSIRRMRDARLR